MKHKIALVVVALTSFFVGYHVLSAEAYYGQSPGEGYFSNSGNDTSGWEVLNVSCSNSGEYGPYNYNNGHTSCNSIPRDLNSAAELIAFIEGRLANGIPNGSYGFSGGVYGDPRARTGAAAIVHTMIGTPTGSRSRPPNATQMADWRNLVNQYAAAGRIQWSINRGFSVNSLYQGTDNSPSPNDVTFYSQYRDGLTIVFTAPDGTQYGIRRECGNPMGGTSLPDLQNFAISGRTTVSDSTVLPGQTITFRHYVRNNGPTGTSPTPIWWVAERTAPAPVATVGGASNGGTFTSGQEKNVFNHNVTIPANAVPNTQYCERVGYDPTNSGGGNDGRGSPACATVIYDFNLTPTVNAVVSSGGTPIAGNIAEPGDTVTFTYAVNNSGLTVSQVVTCTYRQATYAGYSTTAPSTAFTPAGANCAPSRTFPANTNTTIATELNVPLNTVNQSICKSLTISPVSHTGSPANRTAQACVHVAAKPYTRVYGGDIAAGSALAASDGSCVNNANGAVVGWNKRAAGGYAGAGAMYAVLAMASITDFASALGSVAGANAQPPTGLSFANTSTNVANGLFGGSLGSVPCIPDHYSTLPTGAQLETSPINLSSLTSGVHLANGAVTITGGSIINPNNRIKLFVNGNVYINTNITYSGNWSVSNAPLFELIVLGNIYIDNDVVRLDGVYVAQRNGASGGEIHTCATTGAPLALSGNLYTTCNPANQPLVINGAFVANQVRLLRTRGTLSQSNAAEATGTSQGGEIFNFNPTLWMNQFPPTGSPTPDYDAIISLPPIL